MRIRAVFFQFLPSLAATTVWESTLYQIRLELPHDVCHYIHYYIRIQEGAQHLVMEAKEKLYPDRICHYPHMKFAASVTFRRSKSFLCLFQDILCVTFVWLARNTAALFPPPGSGLGMGQTYSYTGYSCILASFPGSLSFHKKEPGCIYTQELYLHLTVSKSV